MDLGLFKNRINVVFDYYYSTTRDMLFLRTASSITGHTQYWTNQGKVRNKGIELTLDTYNFTKKNFTWNTSVNFSLNRNRLLDLGGEARMIKEGYSKERYINIVGGPAIQFYGYKTDGIWKTQEELDAGPKFSTNIDRVGGLKVVDTYKDGELNDKDMTVIGNPYPDFTWGITNTFKIWDFDVQILFQGVHGGDVINADATYKDMQIRNEKYNIHKRWVSEQHVGDGKTPTTYGVPWINTDYDVGRRFIRRAAQRDHRIHAAPERLEKTPSQEPPRLRNGKQPVVHHVQKLQGHQSGVPQHLQPL